MITKMYLLNVPLDKDYKHTLYFDSSSAQKSYFDSKIKHSYTDFTYQRKDNTVRVPIVFDDALKCNYVMYQNSDYSNKWYYAFITDYVWSDEDTTTLTIETDVLQTYMFDYTLLTSFVEREHTADDTIGANTYPEGLECGEFVCKYRDSVTELQDVAYVIGVTEAKKQVLNETKWVSTTGGIINGIYSGITYLYYSNSEISKLQGVIEEFNAGKTDAIKSIFMYPYALINKNHPEGWVSLLPEGWQAVIGSEKPVEINKTFSRGGIYNYTPRNNKVFTYPYQYILVSNNNGGSAIYHFEHFSSDLCEFSVRGCLTPGGSIRLIPKNYKGLIKNDEEGLNLGKYPICNWTSDEYLNWLTQNSVNIGLNIASGVGQIVAGGAVAVGTGGLGLAVGGSQIVGGVSAITGQLAQIHQMSLTPEQSRGNLNCGDVITADNTNTFFIHHMSIKDEYMKIIDDYFTMFGYKCNRVKVPEKAHRENWWFTKTIDVNISGDVPQMDMEKIKNCYNNGITFWRNGIKNYNRSNVIV